jgi:hypothetical protein
MRLNKVFFTLLIGITSVMMGSQLKAADVVFNKDTVFTVSSLLKNDSYFRNAAQQIETDKNEKNRGQLFQKLYENAVLVYRLQEDLAWLNMDAIRLAFADMKQSKSYNPVKYQPLMEELEQLAKKGFNGIYQLDGQAIQDAKKALANKRAILLSNPLLDGDKIVATRFKVGKRARGIMSPSLGTQSNNWSNQQSARRNGFDAEIVEMTNLRDDIRFRTVYKPQDSASIADLKMHWNGDRVMFTSILPDKRWSVFEVKLD